MMSAVAPGGSGTIQRIGRAGYCCAPAAGAASAPTIKATVAASALDICTSSSVQHLSKPRRHRSWWVAPRREPKKSRAEALPFLRGGEAYFVAGAVELVASSVFALAFLLLVSVSVDVVLSDLAEGVAGVAGVALAASPLADVAGVAGVAFIGSPLGAGVGALVCALARLAAAANATATAVVRNLFMASP